MIKRIKEFGTTIIAIILGSAFGITYILAMFAVPFSIILLCIKLFMIVFGG